MRFYRLPFLIGSVILLLFSILPTAATAAEPAPSPDGGLTPTVIDGDFVTKAPPWIAALYYEGYGFTCTGTLVAPRWVLTATHCIYDGYAMSVRVGNLSHADGKYAGVRRFVRAPRADMALLYLDRAIRTSFVPLTSADPPIGSINQIYGWGTTEPGTGQPTSDRLKVGNVRVVSTDGTDYVGGRSVRSQVAPAGPGYGDSGGPQMYNGKQVGVCSTGDYVYQDYGSIAASRAWIRRTAGV
jgi:secreted trypsin-like serine protease